MQKAGLREVVEFRIGDALDYLRMTSETFDFVLVDIWKRFYVPCFELFFPKLRPDAFVVADNMIYPLSHRKEVEEYRNTLRETNAFDTILLPIGSGIEVSRLKRGLIDIE